MPLAAPPLLTPPTGTARPDRPGKPARRPAGPWVFLAALVALPWLALVEDGFVPDTFWQLASGRWMVTRHAVLAANVFSFTNPAEHWTNVEWGWELLEYLIYRGAGPMGVVALSALCADATLIFAWAAARRLGASPWRANVLSGLVFVYMLAGLVPRPEMASYAFVAGLLWLLTYARTHPKALWWAVPGMCVWANLHGSMLLGLAILALETAVAFLPPLPASWSLEAARLPRRTVTAVTVASAAAACITPFGPTSLGASAWLAANPTINHFVSEWEPPNLASPYNLVLIALPLSWMVWVLVIRRPRLDLARTALVVGAAIATAHSERMFPYLGIAMVVAVAPLPATTSALAARLAEKAARLAPAAALVVVAAVGVLHPPALGTQVDPHIPTAAVQAAGAAHGRLLTTYEAAGYAIWEGDQVFVDGRAELYTGNGVFRDYIDLTDGLAPPGPILKRWGITEILWPSATSSITNALSQWLSASSCWKPVAHWRPYWVLWTNTCTT